MSTSNDDFRNYKEYEDSERNVSLTYKLNHQNQTYDHALNKINKYCTNHDICKMSIWQAIQKLDNIIDDSDPDITVSQMNHAYQTAEGMRKLYPEQDDLHLIGLIHDLGKVLVLDEFGSLPQWSVVGDNYPLGCAFSNKIIYYNYFQLNSDYYDPKYNTKLGIYEENIGLDKIIMSFSHDFYFFSVCQNNKCLLPRESLKIIRYHSFYSWHHENAYSYLMNDEDYTIRDLCYNFSCSDLYTKEDSKVDTAELQPYYEKLINKYFPDTLLTW